MSNTVGYVRVSTEEQVREGVSLDAQEARLRAYATAKDLHLTEIIRDEAESGKNLRRPGIARLIELCENGECGGVVVVKLDRLSRRTRDLLHLVEDVFEPNEVALHSLNETVDTTTASGRFFLRIMGALAEMERELISERTTAALAHIKAQGVRLGGVPLGFARVGTTNDLVPVAEELALVQRILGLWRRGQSYRQIAAKLNEEGVETRQNARWHHTTVAKVVRRRQDYQNVLEAS